MGPYTFFTTLVEAVGQDSGLQIWSSALTGATLTIYKGKPVATPDPAADAPCLVFYEPTRSMSQTRSSIRYLMQAELYLAISGSNNFNPAGDIELAGYKNGEEGAQKVYEAITENLPGGIMLDLFEDYHDVQAVSNLTLSIFNMEFIKRLAIGESQF